MVGLENEEWEMSADQRQAKSLRGTHQLRFEVTGGGSCSGCFFISGKTAGLPCSKGNRDDGTAGIWKRINA